MGGTRPSVFETPRMGDHGSGEGGFEGVFFEGLSFGSRRVVDAAGEASRFVERFAGDVSSARWSRSRLACASTWILSLRISSRASLRLVCGRAKSRARRGDASSDEGFFFRTRDDRPSRFASRPKPIPYRQTDRARVFHAPGARVAAKPPPPVSRGASRLRYRLAPRRSPRPPRAGERPPGLAAAAGTRGGSWSGLVARGTAGRAPRAGTKRDEPSCCVAPVPGSRARGA